MSTKLAFVITAFMLAITPLANAAVIFEDDFDYDVVANTDYASLSASWVQADGATSNVAVTPSDNLSLTGQDGEVAFDFSPATSGPIFVGLDLIVTDAPNGGGKNFGGFATGATSSSANRSQLGITNVNSTMFSTGSSNGGSSTDFTKGVLYRAVYSFEAGGAGNAWVALPGEIDELTPLSGPSSNNPANAARFLIGFSGGSGNLVIDNLVIATTFSEALDEPVTEIPEPASFALLAAGGLVMISRRRK